MSKGSNLLGKIPLSTSQGRCRITSGDRRNLRHAFYEDVDAGVVTITALVETFGLTSRQARTPATAVDSIVAALPTHTRAAWAAAVVSSARRRLLRRLMALPLIGDIRGAVAAFCSL